MDPFLAYLTSACDPLTGVVRRVATERAAVAELVADPVRAGVWFAAMIGPFVRALPPDDPWRSLTVRLPDGRRVPRPGTAAHQPGAPTLGGAGAITSDGKPFGHVGSHLDLQPRGAADVADDIGLAGFAEELPLPAAYLIAAASETATTAELAAECIRICGLSPGDGGYRVPAGWSELFGGTTADTAVSRPEGFFLLSSALRWTMFRYRLYTGDAAVSAEAPQLAIEVDHWLAGIDVSGVDPHAPDPSWTDALAASLAVGDEPPPLRGMPIPPGAYEEFRIG